MTKESKKNRLSKQILIEQEKAKGKREKEHLSSTYTYTTHIASPTILIWDCKWLLIKRTYSTFNFVYTHSHSHSHSLHYNGLSISIYTHSFYVCTQTMNLMSRFNDEKSTGSSENFFYNKIKPEEIQIKKRRQIFFLKKNISVSISLVARSLAHWSSSHLMYHFFPVCEWMSVCICKTAIVVHRIVEEKNRLCRKRFRTP